jgi:hypothetical protein
MAERTTAPPNGNSMQRHPFRLLKLGSTKGSGYGTTFSQCAFLQFGSLTQKKIFAEFRKLGFDFDGRDFRVFFYRSGSHHGH